jgi:hypothetical protein
MKKLIVGTMLCLSFLLGACNVQPTFSAPITSEPLEAQADFWQPLGGLIDSSGGARISHFNGVPYIAYGSYANGLSNISVKAWNGNAKSWVQLGSLDVSSNLTHYSIFDYDLTIDTSGRPVVVWGVSSSAGVNDYHTYIYAKRWNGSSWATFGSDLTTSSPLFSMTLDSRGRPYMALVTNGLLYVRRWNGVNWIDIGQALNPPPRFFSVAASSPELQLDSSNYPVVVWQNHFSSNIQVSSSYAIALKRWNGSGWVSIGSTITNHTIDGSLQPDLVLKTDRSPIISFNARSSTGASQDVFVKQY